METDLQSYRRLWARPLAAARCVLALACLIFQLFLAPVDFIWFTMAIALFAASSLVAVMRPEMLGGAFGLLALFIDTVFFMVLARYGVNETLWFAPVFYLYLLTAAIALYGPREVLLVSGVCILLALTPYPDPLRYSERPSWYAACLRAPSRFKKNGWRSDWKC